LKNWGLLNALAQPIESLQLQWDTTLTTAMANATAKGYELEIWRTLTPLRWRVSCGSSDYCDCGLVTLPADYPDTASGGPPLTYDSPDLVLSLYVYVDHCNDAPPQLALDHLLHAPNADGTGPLGVPLEDFYCGFNGWRMPGSLGSTCTNHSSVGAVRQAHQQRLQQNRAARVQLQNLLHTVRRQVKDKAVRNQLMGTLQQALLLLRQGRGEEAPALPRLAELTLQGFILQAKA